MTREEAIEVYNGLMNPTIIEAFEVLVPELKEIGYDRMLEQIIRGFENWKGNGNLTFNNLRVDDIIDWLEKQKEQKPIQTSEEKEYIRTLKNLLSAFIRDKQPEDVAYYQKIYDWLDGISSEQKPVPISCSHENGTSAEHSCSNDNSEYDKGYMDGKAFQLKQTEQYSIGKTFMGLIPCWVNAPSTSQPAHKYHGKNAVIMHENNGGFRCCFIDDEKATTVHLPEDTLFAEGWRKRPAEWSEEDKKELNCIINILDRLGFEEFCKSSRDQDIEEERFYYKEIQFLKRLKSLHPRPKVEWSEEDGEMLNSIIRVVCGIGVQPSNGLREKQVRFLKSLRPSWKPSEEQMNALLALFNDPNNIWSESCQLALSGLYEQLKKLM